VTIMSIWIEHRDHPIKDWKEAVANDSTRLGYWDWVDSMVEFTQQNPPPITEAVDYE